MEGDARRTHCRYPRQKEFLSTPSGWRATRPAVPSRRRLAAYFYPRPPGGGRREPVFIPTANVVNFYPRPPGGGRHTYSTLIFRSSIFLSTPSGWRATSSTSVAPSPSKFLSTPSGWRATSSELRGCTGLTISIHALRVEGDLFNTCCTPGQNKISIHALRVEGDVITPAGVVYRVYISIHALRVEGDYKHFFNRFAKVKISIHALRVEGDDIPKADQANGDGFLSTPSGWRATDLSIYLWYNLDNFYPRPPGGGRLTCQYTYGII